MISNIVKPIEVIDIEQDDVNHQGKLHNDAIKGMHFRNLSLLNQASCCIECKRLKKLEEYLFC